MAVDDLLVLNLELPELFGKIEPPVEWLDDFVFLPVSQPDVFHQALNQAPERQTDADLEGYLSGAGDDAQGLVSTGMPLSVVLPYGGPGAPVPLNIEAAFPPPDAFAFYLPFHYFFPNWWGVYLIAEGVALTAQRLVTMSGGQLGPGKAVQITRLFLYHHEAYHHMVECFATRLELTHRKPLYKAGFETLFRRTLGTGDCAEEALATLRRSSGQLMPSSGFRRRDQSSRASFDSGLRACRRIIEPPLTC